ncbi:MAG: VTT domain-containing protein [Chloroflexi bacterium]|jgi:uncharacterized membrane protein YdjX (TVP38/TMEM64 family)|nr:VTT domain-containing protein [Chloroflexota bacterium]
MDNKSLNPPEEGSASQRASHRLSERALNVIRAFILLGVIALTVILFIYRERIQALQGLGYPGVFLFSVLANATILVPLPGVVFTSAMGAVFHPFWVSIAAGAGAALGELSGYMAGFSGRAVVEKSHRYDRVVGWMRKYGDLTILFLAFVPNPVFDLAGVLAGMLKMPVGKFLLYCLVGKILKMMLFAYAGNWVIGLLEGVF